LQSQKEYFKSKLKKQKEEFVKQEKRLSSLEAMIYALQNNQAGKRTDNMAAPSVEEGASTVKQSITQSSSVTFFPTRQVINKEKAEKPAQEEVQEMNDNLTEKRINNG